MALNGRSIVWLNVVTVVSAAILIGAEVSVRPSPAPGRSPRCSTSAKSASASSMAIRTVRHRHHGAVRAPRTPHRAVHRAPLSDARHHAATVSVKVKEVFARANYFACTTRKKMLFPFCPISHVPVAVCRSVGSRTRGRPAAEDNELLSQREVSFLKTSDRQPEAKPAHSALSRGRA